MFKQCFAVSAWSARRPLPSRPASSGNTAAYFDALTSHRSGDAGPIVERFSDAARYAAVSGKKLVDDLAHEQERSRELLGEPSPLEAGAWKVLPHLIAHPVINSAYLQEHLGIRNAMAAGRALKRPTAAGVLREATGLRRNRVWQHHEILGILRQLRREHPPTLGRQKPRSWRELSGAFRYTPRDLNPEPTD